MKSDQFFKVISDGLIDHSIEFSIWSYVYMVHNVNRQDTGYRAPFIEESEAKGYCSIEYFEEEKIIHVCIDNMAFYWDVFPSRFSSTIDPKKCRVDGDKNEDIRTVIIPFDDMSDGQYDNYRMELMFKNKELISIIFVISKLDINFNGTMTNLQLIGELCKE